MLKKKENIRSVIELFSYIVRVALLQIFCFTMYQKKKERYSIRLRSLEGRMLQERKIEDWCGRRRRSTIDLEAKYDKEGIPRDVSRCIDDYRSSGSDLSFRGRIGRVDKLAIEFLRHSKGQFLRRRTISRLILERGIFRANFTNDITYINNRYIPYIFNYNIPFLFY